MLASYEGYTGEGFAGFIHEEGDFIEWTLHGCPSQEARLTFRYALGSSIDRPLKVYLNGVVLSSKLVFVSTGQWDRWSTVSIVGRFVGGTNIVRVSAIGMSGANVDALVVSEGR